MQWVCIRVGLLTLLYGVCGVLAYVHQSIPVSRLTTAEEDDKEVLWLLLSPPRTPRPFSSVIIAIVYYPPGQNAECGTDMIEYLTRNLDRLLYDRPSSAIVIAGDFNKLNLTRLCNRFNLKKSILAPTRGNNTLDQVLTNMQDMYNPTIYLPPLGHSDHQCLFLVPKQKEKLPIYCTRARILTPGNLAVLSRKVILEDWSDVYAVQEIDEKVKVFTSIMLTIMDDPAGIRRCFDVDIRLKQHRDVDNEISTWFQRCSQDVASTL